MKRYELYGRKFKNEKEFTDFADKYGIYKWHAYCGAFEHTEKVEMSEGINFVVRIPASNHTHWTKVQKLTEMGFEKIGLIKQ